MSDDLPLFLIFAAGLLSFLSPCVLPLVPSYFSILGGVGLGRSSFQPRLVRAAAESDRPADAVSELVGAFAAALSAA